MLKLNIIAFIVVAISFSLWFSSSRSFFAVDTLLKSQNLSSAEPLSAPSKEQILEDEIRRLKKNIKLLQSDVKRLDQDILRIDKRYMELWDFYENQSTELAAYKFKTNQILNELEKTILDKKENVPTTKSPYSVDYEKPPNEIGVQNPNSVTVTTPLSANQAIPFNLILNVPTITEEQKTQYRTLFIEHNQKRNELVRNRGTISQEELMKKLEDFRLAYEPKFQAILRSDQLSDYEKVVMNYKIQRDQNQKMREERKNLRPNQPNQAGDVEKK